MNNKNIEWSRLMRDFSFVLLLSALVMGCGTASTEDSKEASVEEPMLIEGLGSSSKEKKTSVQTSGDFTFLMGYAQGSTFTIKYLDPQQRDFSQPIDSIFKMIDQSLSLWVEGSSINELNSGDSVTLRDPHLFAVLAKSQEVHWQTNMAFDPTVDTLMRFWGFRGKNEPDTTLLPGVLQHVGLGRMVSFFDWEMKGTAKAQLTFAGFDKKMSFDPNGVAQGYTVDVIHQFLGYQGIQDHMIEVGGEVRTKGKNPEGNAWSIQIDKPVEGNEHIRQAVIELNNTSMATSGNYRKFREINGKRYGHTIDPRTGYPVEHGLLSATVVAEDCAIADALATAFMVMGEEATITWLEEHPKVSAYLIMDDGNGGLRTWQSTDLTIR